jgi:hypothetical protein
MMPKIGDVVLLEGYFGHSNWYQASNRLILIHHGPNRTPMTTNYTPPQHTAENITYHPSPRSTYSRLRHTVSGDQRLVSRMWGTLALSLALSIPLTAAARVTRIIIDNTQPPVVTSKSFAGIGPYRVLTGHICGELDPKDPHNTIITDIDLAPVKGLGMVPYTATFTLQEPVDLSKSNGVMLYAVPNRGNRISAHAFGVAGETGDEFLMKHGYIILHSGWQGDLPVRAGTETITVPVAQNPDGSSVTGVALARFVNMQPGTRTLRLPPFHTAANLDTSQATLTQRASNFGEILPVASDDWAFADCTKQPFPGVPDANRISVRGGFNSTYLYELSYTARDPLVLGVGLAATRDIVSFFRYEAEDGEKTPNPIAGHVMHVIAQGVSQAGDFERTFIHLGFNQDERGRIVWDGANPHIAPREVAINIRFAHPSGIESLYEPGTEATLWWGDYTDAARGPPASSMLDRALASNTCPRIFETFGSAEFWNLRMSPGLVGTRADQDIPLPSNVRRFYFPGTTHGGGSGGFNADVPASPTTYELPANPDPEADTMRALLVALTDWVSKDIDPPASVYPRLDNGQLVLPDHRAMGFPAIPGMPLPDNLINPFFDYDFGPKFDYQDLSGVMTIQPPIIRGRLPQLVPKVDSDGNETSGIPSALHQAPLGTYVGWNVVAGGFYKGVSEGLSGGFIPFAKTRSQRLEHGDPRPSLEERYHDHAGYVAAVKKAVVRLLAERFLLPEDADRLVRQAEASNVLNE